MEAIGLATENEMKKLYVGNLPYEVTEEQISEKFNQFGTTESVKIITDRETGRGKGFGFVEMSSDEEAQSALDGLNGQDFGGRPLRIDFAQDKKPAGGGGGHRGGGFKKGPRNFNR